MNGCSIAMMARLLTATVLGSAVVGLLLTIAGSTTAVEALGQTSLKRTVFASVVAKDGTPITDMTAADFEVREGGKVQEITSVRLGTTPMRVHTIVSDGGTGAFQLGVLRMAQVLAGRAEFALTSVLIQPERVTEFTANPDSIGAAIQKLGRRGVARGGSQVMEAILGALKDIAAPGTHPVLIVLRVGNEEASAVGAGTVRDALRMSGATMYVVSRAGASKAAPTSAGVNNRTAEVAQRQMNDDELAFAALNLNLVLGDGSRESGGYQQEISLTAPAAPLELLANQIKNQYEITYVLPAGAKPSDRLQVTTKRKNLILRAPQKIPN